jgi:hypothetical protein
MSYIIIKGDRIVGETKSIKKAKKMCDRIEKKDKTNCTVAREVNR